MSIKEETISLAWGIGGFHRADKLGLERYTSLFLLLASRFFSGEPPFAQDVYPPSHVDLIAADIHPITPR